jgi:hypothetical protein
VDSIARDRRESEGDLACVVIALEFLDTDVGLRLRERWLLDVVAVLTPLVFVH